MDKEYKELIVPVHIPNGVPDGDIQIITDSMMRFIEANSRKIKFEVFYSMNQRSLMISDSYERVCTVKLENTLRDSYIIGFDFNPDIHEFYLKVQISISDLEFKDGGMFVPRILGTSSTDSKERGYRVLAFDYVENLKCNEIRNRIKNY